MTDLKVYFLNRTAGIPLYKNWKNTHQNGFLAATKVSLFGSTF